MTYSLIDDQFDIHPKHIEADWDVEHYGVQVCAISHCNRHGTDGRVSEAAVRRFGRANAKKNLAVANDLVTHGFWRKVDGGFEIIGFLDHNPSRAQVLAKRAEVSAIRSEAGRLGGLRSAESRRSKTEPPAKQTGSKPEAKEVEATKQTEALSFSDPSPIQKEISPPSPLTGEPAHEPTSKPARAKKPAKREVLLPDDFGVSPAIVDICQREGLSNPFEALVDMRDWAAEKSIKRADWEATFRRWMRDDRTTRKHGVWDGAMPQPPRTRPPAAKQPDPSEFVPPPADVVEALRKTERSLFDDPVLPGADVRWAPKPKESTSGR